MIIAFLGGSRIRIIIKWILSTNSFETQVYRPVTREKQFVKWKTINQNA